MAAGSMLEHIRVSGSITKLANPVGPDSQKPHPIPRLDPSSLASLLRPYSPPHTRYPMHLKLISALPYIHDVDDGDHMRIDVFDAAPYVEAAVRHVERITGRAIT